MRKQHLTLIITTIFILAGCNKGPEKCGNEKAILEDNFNDTECGWDEYDASHATAGYATSEFFITVKESNTSAVAVPGLDIADSWLQVETRIAGGTADNNYGLVCRYRDMDHFYAFLISGDGYYAIVKVMENADYQILSGDGMHLLPSEIIQTELGATNEIRAECEGDRLTLSVNGKQLASVKDQEYTLGDIGFIASSYQGAPTEVRFDNLLVLRPFGTEEETE